MKALCSNGVKAVVLDLIVDFERTAETRLAITWASTNMLMDEIRNGATGDLAILTDEAIDDLIRQGKIVVSAPLKEVKDAHGGASLDEIFVERIGGG